MNGWRGRIGVIIPATNTAVEGDFWRLASDGISVHTARMLTKEHVTFDTLEAMEGDSVGAAKRVSQCKPNAVVFACTSGSFLKGPEWNEKIEQQLSEVTNCPVLTTTTAAEKALKHVNAKNIDVISPYVPKTNERLIEYFTKVGFNINNIKAFEMINQYDHGAIEPREIYQLAMETHTKGSDALFIACTQLRSLDVLDYLERDLNIPVIGAIQATWWYTLQKIGIYQPVNNCGSLLR